MGLLANLWITRGRLTRRGRRERSSPIDRWEARHAWIEKAAPGRSFADVGGLFSIAGDVALAAERAGAAPVTLFDGGDPPLTDFPAKAEAAGSKIRTVQGDLEDPAAVRQIGVHDLVYCTGLIYHTPNPQLQLMHLREITKDELYLGTHTIPEVPGVPQACVFYPYMPDSMREAMTRAYPERPDALGVVLPFDDRPMMGYGNFWWGITPSALRAMLRAARFEIVEEIRPAEWPFLLDVIARPIPKPPLMPPVSYYRERAEARAKGADLPPYEDFYEKTGRGFV